MLSLNNDNYYSKEANEAYWSASQVKAFLKCEASALAEIQGDYEPEPTQALLMGSYIDAYVEGLQSFAAWRDAHPEIFKRDGTLKAEFVKAAAMIDRMEHSPVFMDYLSGDKQTIWTGNIAGLPFKAKLDVYVPGERIVDLKTIKDLEPVYVPGAGRLAYYDAWNWPLQMAIYQELVFQNTGDRLPTYLAVVTKEDPPTLDLVEIPQWRLDAEMEFLQGILPRLDAIKDGIIEPERCERCAWCRETKIITGPRTIERIDTEEGADQ